VLHESWDIEESFQNQVGEESFGMIGFPVSSQVKREGFEIPTPDNMGKDWVKLVVSIPNDFESRD
jgi:hypothetical protein